MRNVRQKVESISRPLSVLVVEDEEQLRHVMAAYLMNDGHTVGVTGDGGGPLRRFHAGRFDLVITDHAMPEMSGEQLAAAIKAVCAKQAGHHVDRIR